MAAQGGKVGDGELGTASLPFAAGRATDAVMAQGRARRGWAPSPAAEDTKQQAGW